MSLSENASPDPTRRPRRSLSEVKRQAIIKAATRLFLKHGFSKTTMDAIAEEAQVTKQTIYAHFKNKDILFSDMVLMQCQRHTPSEDMLRDEQMPLEKLMYEVGLGFLDMITSREGLATHRLVMAEAERRPKLAQLFFETGPLRMNQLLEDYLARQNLKGVLAIPNPGSAASYFFSMLKGRYHLRMALRIKPLPTRLEIEEHVRETVRVFLKIYGGDAPLHTLHRM